MKSRLPLLFALAALATFGVACGGDEGESDAPPTFAFGLDATVVAGDGNADAVNEMVFAPGGRMFYAEQHKGTIRVILADGSLQTAPFATLTVATWLDLDWGITGLALDPDFEDNHYVYVFYTAVAGENIGKPTLVRFTEADGVGTDETVLSDDFPETVSNHQGYNSNGEIHFGPDGFLYASVGDYDLASVEPELVTDLSSPIGKMLRLDKNGDAAPGNPFEDDAEADARVFAFGFREPFSFTFGTDGTLYGTDNTTVSCEELNVIEPGDNYGWPEMGEFPFSDCTVGPGTQPIHNFAREGSLPGGFIGFTEVSALSFLEGSTYTSLTDSLIVCESEKSSVEENGAQVVKPGVLRRLVLTGSDAVAASELIINDCKGGAATHAGEVYYANGNQIKKLIQTDRVDEADQTELQTPPPVS